MKIQRFNEKFGDDFTYKGNLIIKFDILKSRIDSYCGAFSDKEVKKLGLDGILEKYIFASLDPSFVNDNFNEMNKVVDYELYDKNGNLIGKDAYDKADKYNI